MKNLLLILSFAFQLSNYSFGQWSNAATFGGSGEDYGESIAVDNNGDYYVTGRYQGAFSIGGQTLPTTNFMQMYIAKFNSSNIIQWVKTSEDFGGGATSLMEGMSISVQTQGDLIAVTGQYYGKVKIGATIVTSPQLQYDFFLALFSKASGNLIRVHQGNGTGVGRKVVITNSSEIYVVGACNSTNFANSGTTVTSTFLAKFNLGSNTWIKTIVASGNNSFAYARGLALDNNGDAYITGTFRGNLNIGGYNFTNSSNLSNIFIAKYNGSGSTMWARWDGSNSSEEIPNDIVADNIGNIFVTGSFNATTNIGGISLNSNSQNDKNIFISKYKANSGIDQVGKSIGSSGNNLPQEAFSITMASNNDILICGSFAGTVNFGGGAISAGNTRDGFVAKYTNNLTWGNMVDVINTITPSSAACYCKSVKMNSNFTKILTTGFFQGSNLQFPPITTSFNSNGLKDFFIGIK